jgi:hypothetical protein
MKELHRILISRYGDKPRGHWVVMHARICNHRVMCMVYAYSHKKCSYFVSTTGKTSPHPIKHMSKYEDNFGEICERPIDRPDLHQFYHKFSPLVDTHNQQRQGILQLEKLWLTKCCWRRLWTTMVGMCVVDMHKWFKYTYDNVDGTPNDVPIKKITNMLCHRLEDAIKDQPTIRTAATGAPINAYDKPDWERITNEHGEMHKKVTPKQRSKGLAQGCAITKSCFVCRKYLKKDGETNYVHTSFRCRICKMPLCKLERMNGPVGYDRKENCMEEHASCDRKFVYSCNGMWEDHLTFPDDNTEHNWDCENPKKKKQRRQY